MGNLCSNSSGTSDPVNDAIEKGIREEKKRRHQKPEVKLLLLGAGESGKSTIAKQMKILHLQGFDDEERKQFQQMVRNNVYNGMISLLEGARMLDIVVKPTAHVVALIGEAPKKDDKKAGKEKVEEAVMQKSAEEIRAGLFDGPKHKEIDMSHVTPPAFEGEVTDNRRYMLADLWRDLGVQEAFKRSYEFQLVDSVAYYMQHLDRIMADDYTPTDDDILHCRKKTSGIIEIDFELDAANFKLVDVGGQRSERNKWMQLFSDVTAVLYCTALNDYNLKLREDETTNRMHESLNLFGEICNCKWLSDAAMILFLNKRDLFEEKILEVPLTVCFPDYTGPDANFEEASKFVEQKFLEKNEKKMVYTHLTTATDTRNVQLVFDAVKDTIIRKALSSLGLV